MNIKNLKHRIREDHEHQMNSPWNIAADFSVDMSFTRDVLQVCLMNMRKIINARWK